MKDHGNLRNDLLAIVLEEAFGMQEHYARKVVGGTLAHNRADQDALDAAMQVVDRIDARCSKIEG